MTTYAMGEEGIRWFFGVVEDRDDPKQVGRVRVRIYNVHPFTAGGNADTVNVPTDHLPWATPINSIVSAGIIGINKDGVGLSPTGILVGTTVFGFFADGRECQVPIVLGTLAGLVGPKEDNELPKSATGTNSAGLLKNSTKIDAASPFPGEPSSAFNAKYPYNKVFRTESGHLIEIDDTVAKERIHIMHKSGTYVEIDQSGQVVIKTVDDRFDVTTKDNNVYVGGNVNVRVKGNVNMLVDGTYTLESKGNMLIKAPRIDFNPNASSS
jgi:hypothetical protein